MSRKWEELIADGLDLKIMEGRVEAEAGNVRWLWGDLALEVAPVGKSGAHNKSTERLTQFVSDLNVQLRERHEEQVSLDALRKYRTVADAWPPGTRFQGETWANHLLLVSNPDRETIIANPVDSETGEKLPRWTWRQLQRHLGQKASPNYVAPPVTTEDKVALAADLLGDLDVAKAIIGRKGAARSNISKAILDEAESPFSNAPTKSFDQRWAEWVNALNTVFIRGAKLIAEGEDQNVELGGHAAVGRVMYERLTERKLDAELRSLLEDADR